MRLFQILLQLLGFVFHPCMWLFWVFGVVFSVLCPFRLLFLVSVDVCTWCFVQISWIAPRYQSELSLTLFCFSSCRVQVKHLWFFHVLGYLDLTLYSPNWKAYIFNRPLWIKSCLQSRILDQTLRTCWFAGGIPFCYYHPYLEGFLWSDTWGCVL